MPALLLAMAVVDCCRQTVHSQRSHLPYAAVATAADTVKETICWAPHRRRRRVACDCARHTPKSANILSVRHRGGPSGVLDQHFSRNLHNNGELDDDEDVHDDNAVDECQQLNGAAIMAQNGNADEFAQRQTLSTRKNIARLLFQQGEEGLLI
ncbi:hypothetical protein niasHT_014554 [Heterodera trifolii]|uniref:Secreted protein n=1 Tax=Heterodera trifolii TaxID=157864 RepID=A0ABD2LHN3_9BILA